MESHHPPATPKRATRIFRYTLYLVAAILTVGLLLPAGQIIPVAGATTADWNHSTYWYHPWGRSGVHKGIDIFARRGTDVVASTGGLVIDSGTLALGGNVVSVLGPKWRVHYYAHLDRRLVSRGDIVQRGEVIGKVGTTGNAAGKPPHLHYAIVTTVPYPWRINSAPQGWKRMLFLDPGEQLQ